MLWGQLQLEGFRVSCIPRETAALAAQCCCNRIHAPHPPPATALVRHRQGLFCSWENASATAQISAWLFSFNKGTCPCSRDTTGDHRSAVRPMLSLYGERKRERKGICYTHIKEHQSLSASQDDHMGVSEVFEISVEEIQVQGQIIHVIWKHKFLSHCPAGFFNYNLHVFTLAKDPQPGARHSFYSCSLNRLHVCQHSSYKDTYRQFLWTRNILVSTVHTVPITDAVLKSTLGPRL